MDTHENTNHNDNRRTNDDRTAVRPVFYTVAEAARLMSAYRVGVERGRESAVAASRPVITT